MAASVEQTGTPIEVEALFRPTSRYRDSHRRRLPESYTEVELLPGLTIESVRAMGITWEDFCRVLQGKRAWMAPSVYVCSGSFYGGGDPWVLKLGGYRVGTGLSVHVTEGTDVAAATATCDFLLRLFATCESHDVNISRPDNGVPPPLSGAGLSLSFQDSRDSLRQVTLYYMALDADQCLALATMSRLDVELGIHECRVSNAAEGAFVECLHSDRGPVKLHNCKIDSQTIAHALTGNSRVTTLKPDFGETNDAEMAILFTALANNRGMLDLDLRFCCISDDNFSILCQSLQAHPTLTNLNLIYTRPIRIRIDADHADHEEEPSCMMAGFCCQMNRNNTRHVCSQR
jgi:hypothetical protein